jgi:hypothetical protein
MLPSTSAALVGAGVLAVLVFPLIAVVLHRSAPLTHAAIVIAAAPSADADPDAGPYDQGSQPVG